MSRRVLDMVRYDDTRLIHRPTDDLESFIWVLIWAILDIPRVTSNLTSNEQIRYKAFRSTSLVDLCVFKSNYYCSLLGRKLPGMAIFKTLLVQWLEHADSVHKRMIVLKVEPSDPLTFYKPIYEKYLSIAFNALGGLPENWNDYSPFGGIGSDGHDPQ